ncbi:MAG: type I DNA topoisomerase [Candidatus Woesebacteria bacterium]|nr:MAG: type I DNA topoisomerase [Candidatus Woesebacteria bacterium]
MNLIIVESPTKAKTLSRFLGKEYLIDATGGHIKDLPKSKLSIDIDHNFEPLYEEVGNKKKYISAILKDSKKAEKIYLASDPDREGEAISQHVLEILKEKKIDKKDIKRIVFHEITKGAVEEAIRNPHEIDENLVNAQIARRVLDRLVGYKLSPLLWKKVRRGLSAGRVQSVAVRLIVEREREINAFKPIEYWEVYVDLASQDQEKLKITVQLTKIDGKKAQIDNKKEADNVISGLEKARYKVFDVKKRTISKNPYAPLTTSTMSQTAARAFGWSAKRTMAVAQKLYENGVITYHRTDSTNISAVAITASRKFIEKEFGVNYLPEKARFYKTKSKVAQEAHEAIRPTDVFKTLIEGDPTELKLYQLIWRRFMACQMAASIYDETVIIVQADKYELRTSGQIMKFDGWRKVMPIVSDEVNLPDVSKDESLDLIKVSPFQKFTEPPARYNEASLIKTLEKLGIGRPSTYAPIISTIQLRSYVEKNEGKFFATSVGMAVSDFLLHNFAEVVDFSFTAEMEDKLDSVANGKTKWQKEIKDFYTPFDKKLSDAEKADRVKIETEKLNEKCPECKEGELVVRVGRFGKFISCSRFPDCKYTAKYMEKINMKCPECRQGEVILKRTKKGRKFYGCSRYPDCKFASWKKPEEKIALAK